MTSYAITLAVHLTGSALASSTELAWFGFATASNRVSLVLSVQQGSVVLTEEYGPNGVEAAAEVARAAFPSTPTGWVEVRFTGTLGGAAPRAMLFVEKLKVAEGALAYVPVGATAPDLLYGVYFSGQNQPAKSLNIDNVIVDVQ